MNEYTQTAIDRLNTFLPHPVHLQLGDAECDAWMPFGLRDTYQYYVGEIEGVKALFAGVGDNPEGATPQILEKHAKILTKNGGLPVVFLFGNMPAYLFARFTQKNLNLIVGNKHLFLPDFLLAVGKGKAQRQENEDTIPPLAQLLLLYHLQKEKINGKTMKGLQNLLHVSYATVNRAVRWLAANDFVKLEGGKEKIIVLNLEGRELWEKAKEQMTSPVDFMGYTPDLYHGGKGLLSGESALSEYTMYNGGFNKQALSREEYDAIKKDVFWDPYAEVEIQVWKYDPKILSDTGVIDKLSLYLLLKDDPDDRIQIELDNMINDIKW